MALPAVEICVGLAVVLLTALLFLRRRRSASAAEGGGGGAAAKGDEFPRGGLTILWGSQTGTAEGFAGELMREARRKGFRARSVDLEDYEAEDICDELEPVVLLMATHGEGEPTDNAMPFYTWANEEATAPMLSELKYAVFGLGNTQYENFCFMGRWAHERLGALGGTAIVDHGEGDDDDDIRNDFEKWTSSLWEALGADGDDEAEAPDPNFEAVFLPPSGANGKPAAPNGEPPASALPWLRRLFPKHQLLECPVSATRELLVARDGIPADGSVVHVELGVQPITKGRSALRYDGADDLGVVCDNGAELAREAAAALGLDPAATFRLSALPSASGVTPPLPTPCTVELALRHYADLRAPAPKPLLLLLAAHVDDAEHAERLRSLCAKEARQEYHDFIVRDGRGLVELLAAFRCATPPPWASVLELTPKLTPRYYTISSSPLADPKTVHMTVKVLREPMRGCAEREKVGVCSTHLGRLRPNDTAFVYVRPSAFRLPRDPAVPVIMVGPGTGIAPFRAFVQQLEVDAKKSGAPRAGGARLYFGCRRSDEDYLYRSELEAAVASGALSCVRTAFSREGAKKVYVQDRLREDGKLLAELIVGKKAHVYLCGGTIMGREVVALVQSLVQAHAGKSEADAAAYIKQMTQQGRLVQELWS